MKTEEKIQKQLDENPIILYMKGIPEQPECGFSAKAVAALQTTGIPFSYVNVLQAPFIREKLPKVSKWPTFPQLFIHGELIGGSDIIEEMTQSGTLQPILQTAVPTSSSDTETISQAEIENMIKAVYQDALISISGEGCDLQITVISDQFAGQTMVKQQQGVMQTIAEPINSGRLHAVSIKSYTYEQWRELNTDSSEQNGLLQIKVD